MRRAGRERFGPARPRRFTPAGFLEGGHTMNTQLTRGVVMFGIALLAIYLTKRVKFLSDIVG
jgi:hypothetical protein